MRLAKALSLFCAVYALSAGSLLGADFQIRCEGVLGNSGEQGPDLVRFGSQHAPGVGPALDSHGALWDRGGSGTLNRYALDGRQLATYSIPAGAQTTDKLTLVGDTLVLRLSPGKDDDSRLFTLNLADSSAHAFKPTGVNAAMIAFSARNNRLACLDAQRTLFLFDPATGSRQEAGVTFPATVRDIEQAPDGTLYAEGRGNIFAALNGKLLSDGWPRPYNLDRIQVLENAVFTQAGHGTIRRLNMEFKDDPGVVLGGASGSFIGHLDENAEITKGQGLACVRPDVFAVSGVGGVIHLLKMNPTSHEFTIVSRIGAVPEAKGLGLDSKGHIFYSCGNWDWSDLPDAPLQNGISGEIAGQASMLDNDVMVAPGFHYGTMPRIISGRIGDLTKESEAPTFVYAKTVTASAAYLQNKRWIFLVLEAGGKGIACTIDHQTGNLSKPLGPVTLDTAGPVKQYTSLAMKSPDVLLAAADGNVIEFKPDEQNWKETSRWNSWGAPADHFGASICIASDSGRLWVADRERHRVVCLDLATKTTLAIFGAVDKLGSGMDSINNPQSIAARGDRAVVHDAGNQRILKLRLAPAR